jgi:hypothetical protein
MNDFGWRALARHYVSGLLIALALVGLAAQVALAFLGAV